MKSSNDFGFSCAVSSASVGFAESLAASVGPGSLRVIESARRISRSSAFCARPTPHHDDAPARRAGSPWRRVWVWRRPCQVNAEETDRPDRPWGGAGGSGNRQAEPRVPLFGQISMVHLAVGTKTRRFASPSDFACSL